MPGWRTRSDARTLAAAGVKVKIEQPKPPPVILVQSKPTIAFSDYRVWRNKRMEILKLFALEDPPADETVEHEIWRFKNAKDAGLFELMPVDGSGKPVAGAGAPSEGEDA